MLNTDDLAKLFGSRTNAVNIDAMTLSPSVFGTAMDVYINMDMPITPDESDDDSTTLPFGQLAAQGLDTITAGGAITRNTVPGYKTFVRFNTGDVAPITKQFRLFPLFNTFTIGWSADIDFFLEIEYTILNTAWNFREEIMDLLANKTQVEDPNLSNLQGKRAVRRAGLFLVED